MKSEIQKIVKILLNCKFRDAVIDILTETAGIITDKKIQQIRFCTLLDEMLNFQNDTIIAEQLQEVLENLKKEILQCDLQN